MVAVEPMAVLEAGDVGAPVPEAEGVQENPGVVGGGFHDGGFGPVDVEEAEEGEGETPDLGEVLHILGDGDPLEGGLYAEGGERPPRFGRRRK